MRPLQVAIVGAGLMGRWHAYYARRAGAEVAAIIDVKASASRALQRKHPRARVFADLAECLGACAVDAVHVCTGIDSHVWLADTALREGKHVLIEKPVAPSPAATENLVSLARERRLKLLPVHQFPFQRGFRHLRRHLEQLGDLVRVDYAICSGGGEGRTNEERARILLEILPHPYSLFRALLGETISQAPWTVCRFTSDDLAISGQLPNVALGVTLSLRGRPPRNEMTLVGTAGTAQLNLFHGYVLIETGETNRRNKLLQPFNQGLLLWFGAGSNLLRRALTREWAYPGLRGLIVQFYRSILNDQAPPIDAKEVLGCAAFLDRVVSGPGTRSG